MGSEPKLSGLICLQEENERRGAQGAELETSSLLSNAPGPSSLHGWSASPGAGTSVPLGRLTGCGVKVRTALGLCCLSGICGA